MSAYQNAPIASDACEERGILSAAAKPPSRSAPVVLVDGLLSTQKDEFDIAGWDILLHAVFPGHPFGAEPAPPVPPRA